MSNTLPLPTALKDTLRLMRRTRLLMILLLFLFTPPWCIRQATWCSSVQEITFLNAATAPSYALLFATGQIWTVCSTLLFIFFQVIFCNALSATFWAVAGTATKFLLVLHIRSLSELSDRGGGIRIHCLDGCWSGKSWIISESTWFPLTFYRYIFFIGIAR